MIQDVVIGIGFYMQTKPRTHAKGFPFVTRTDRLHYLNRVSTQINKFTEFITIQCDKLSIRQYKYYEIKMINRKYQS